MKLSKFANEIGISYSTALRMFKKHQIPGAFKLPSGTIIIPENAIQRLKNENFCNEDVLARISLALQEKFDNFTVDKIVKTISDELGADDDSD